MCFYLALKNRYYLELGPQKSSVSIELLIVACLYKGFSSGSVVKNSPASAEHEFDPWIRPAAPLQHPRVEVGVAARVLGQVVAAHEALVADGAAELLFPRVCAVVPCQLVGARELLVAVLPAAGEGALSCG